MIVYVESNFLLELALTQEQAAAAESILALAESGALTLIFPSFALSEPFSNLTRRSNERGQAYAVMRQQIRDLARSGAHQQVAAQFLPVLGLLARVGTEQMNTLVATVDRLLGAGSPTSLDPIIAPLERRQIGSFASFASLRCRFPPAGSVPPSRRSPFR